MAIKILPILLASLSVILGGGRSLSATDSAQILTYNIRYLNTTDGADEWRHRTTAVVDTIRMADVIGLQEVVAEQLADIQAGTPEWEWYGRGRDNGAEKGEMTPIGWRKDRFTCAEQGTFWLSEAPEQVGQKSWDAALPRIASWVRLQRTSDKAELIIVNTHFDHVGREARRNSARLLRTWVAKHRGEAPAILMGDLNAKLHDAPLDELLDVDKQTSPALLDAMVASRSAAQGPNSTWNGFKEIAEGQRIDHVLIAGDIQVASYQTLNPKTEAGRFASDHLPILTSIQW